MKREVKKKCVFGKCHALKSLLMGGEVEISNYIPASYVTSFLQGVGGKESNSALKGKKKQLCLHNSQDRILKDYLTKPLGP